MERTAVNLVAPGSRVPDACVLPTAAQPIRLAEFDALAALAMDAERIDSCHLRWSLPAEPAVAAQAADLAVRESQCCAFFAFSLNVSGESLTLDVRVPAGQESVLDGLVGRVAATETR